MSANQTFTEMKKQAEAKLAAKGNSSGIDHASIKTWENCLAGNMPSFFTNTAAKQTLTVAVAAYQELAAKQPAKPAAVAPTSSAAPTPEKTATATPAQKTTAHLNGFAKVSAAFTSKADAKTEKPPARDPKSLTGYARASAAIANRENSK